MTEAVIQHLVISTIFAAIVAGVVWVRKTDSASVRYYLWLAAALKFALPTAIFAAFGAWVHELVPVRFIPLPVYPRTQVVNTLIRASGGHGSWVATIPGFVWLIGVAGFVVIWIVRVQLQQPLSEEAPVYLVEMVSELARRLGLRRRVAVRSGPAGYGLALYGIFQSMIVIPNSFIDSLSREELEAVLAHELIHVRRWDNLAAVVIHLITCTFWFHPALWWIEQRLRVERELACDEAVIDQGWSASSYTTGILKLCQFHFGELEAGACGFLGLSLKRRMERIMSYQSKDYKKRNGFILAALGAVLTLVPMTVGFMSAGGIYGQSAKEDMHQQDATCVFAGKHYPEGAVIHQEGGHEQLCAVSFNGSMWVRTSPEIRQRGQSVVEVAVRVPHVPFCTPKESTLDKKLCSCEEGGVYSPGSIVDSARGRLSCTAGLWNPTRTGK